MTRKCVRILLCLLTYFYMRNEREYALRVRNFILLQTLLPHIRRSAVVHERRYRLSIVCTFSDERERVYEGTIDLRYIYIIIFFIT